MTGLYKSLRKLWNFQIEGKVEQIIAIVITHSVFLFFLQPLSTLWLWNFFWSAFLLLSEGHAIFLLFLGKSQNKIQTEITLETKRRNYRSSHQSYSARKGVLRNFAKFTGRHLSQSLFLNKVAGFRNYRSRVVL